MGKSCATCRFNGSCEDQSTVERIIHTAPVECYNHVPVSPKKVTWEEPTIPNPYWNMKEEEL